MSNQTAHPASLSRQAHGGVRAAVRRLFARRPPAPDTRMSLWNSTGGFEIAHTIHIAGAGSARRKGLLGRSSLPAGEGLWIVPCEAVHTFGMQFRLDLIYLDRRRKVQKLVYDVPPWRISACLKAHSIIELAAGGAHVSKIRHGDILDFRGLPRQS